LTWQRWKGSQTAPDSCPAPPKYPLSI
jgi:hypothetical protein